MIGAGRRRHADEEVLLPFRPVRIVEHDVEAGEPERRRDGEEEGDDPAERLQVEQDEAVEHERRRDAEIDEIGEGIELGAEARGALEQARHAPVDAVEGGRDQDGEDGRLETSLEGKADGRQAEAERDQGDHVRRDDAERHRLEQAPARLHRIGRERRKQVAHAARSRCVSIGSIDTQA